jgi:hypothetical protein
LDNDPNETKKYTEKMIMENTLSIIDTNKKISALCELLNANDKPNEYTFEYPGNIHTDLSDRVLAVFGLANDTFGGSISADDGTDLGYLETDLIFENETIETLSKSVIALVNTDGKLIAENYARYESLKDIPETQYYKELTADDRHILDEAIECLSHYNIPLSDRLSDGWIITLDGIETGYSVYKSQQSASQTPSPNFPVKTGDETFGKTGIPLRFAEDLLESMESKDFQFSFLISAFDYKASEILQALANMLDQYSMVESQLIDFDSIKAQTIYSRITNVAFRIDQQAKEMEDIETSIATKSVTEKYCEMQFDSGFVQNLKPAETKDQDQIDIATVRDFLLHDNSMMIQFLTDSGKRMIEDVYDNQFLSYKANWKINPKNYTQIK